jgi:hypothetical protein
VAVSERLYWSQRKILGRLSWVEKSVGCLFNPERGESEEVAECALMRLLALGLAAWNEHGWFLTDAGAMAAARGGELED